MSLTGIRPIQRTEARNPSYEKDPTEHEGDSLQWQGKHQKFLSVHSISSRGLPRTKGQSLLTSCRASSQQNLGAS